jgi:hypothetical protein
MAYLSDDDKKNQQDSQNQQGGFNILSPASSATTGQGNAQNYSQDYEGGDNQKASSPNLSNTGLTSGTSGGGYINFQSYAKANPSTANQIGQAGKNLVQNEKNSTQFADPNSGFSFAPPDSSVDINSSVGSALSSGSDADLAKLKGWANESYTTPDISYSPSAEWQQNASQLSQTPELGGANSPSVIDYLARPDIQAGRYGLGERTLDQALISADPTAQNAIKSNQQMFGDWTNDVSKKLTDLRSQASSNAQRASDISGRTTGALTSALNNNKADVQKSVNDFNSDQEQRKMAEVKAYQDWLNNNGFTTGTFNVNNTAGSIANAGNIGMNDKELAANRAASVLGLANPFQAADPNAKAAEKGNYQWNTTQNSAVGYNQLSDRERAAALQGDPNAPSIYSFEAHLGKGMPAMTPEQAHSYLGSSSLADLQSTYNQLGNELSQYDWSKNPTGAERIKQEQQLLGGELKGRQQDPRALAASLGLTPEDLKSLGF